MKTDPGLIGALQAAVFVGLLKEVSLAFSALKDGMYLMWGHGSHKTGRTARDGVQHLIPSVWGTSIG